MKLFKFKGKDCGKFAFVFAQNISDAEKILNNYTVKDYEFVDSKDVEDNFMIEFKDMEQPILYSCDIIPF